MQVKHLLLIAILALTAACSSNKETVDENLSESQLYQQAQDDLNNKSYNSAVTKLKALESRYPFGRYAEQAQLELIYANYKNMGPKPPAPPPNASSACIRSTPTSTTPTTSRACPPSTRTAACWRASCRWT